MKIAAGQIRDRGPFIAGRSYDVSASIADRLELTEQGVKELDCYILKP